MARTAIFVATIVASILTSTEVVGLDPAETSTSTVATTTTVVTEAPDPVEAPPTTAPPTTAQPTVATGRNLPCGIDPGPCDPEPASDPAPAETVASCALLGLRHTPSGDTDIVAAATEAPDGATRIRIEVEQGLAIDAECFAGEVIGILNDERGWGVPFALEDGDGYDLRLVLASPGTTDSLCYPAKTNGLFSCRSGNRVVINLMRWESGTDDYAGDLTTYRRYLINHEVGHFLGKGHVQCPEPGEPAPVMMQQTKGIGGCIPNDWPTDYEP